MHIRADTALEQALVGGIVLGLSSSALMLLHARINGLSGIIKATVQSGGEDWQITYSAGLAFSGLIASKMFPSLLPHNNGDESSISIPVLAIAGLLVGYGTKISGGCTSGHGLCGLSRWSPRSLVAVTTFMATGAISAFLSRALQVSDFAATSVSDLSFSNLPLVILPTLGVLGLSYLYNSDIRVKQPTSQASPFLAHVIAIGCSLTFGFGLMFSQMTDSTRVLNFLDFSSSEHGWDPSLMGVMGGGVCITAITYPLMKSMTGLRSVTENKAVCDVIKMGAVGQNTVIDTKLITGAALFGLGWGLGGMCPGPAMVLLGAGSIKAAVFVPGMLLGMMIRHPNMR